MSRMRHALQSARRYTLVGVLILAIASPIVWIALSSLKRNAELLRMPPTFLPDELFFGHYYELLFQTNFPIYLRNSFVVAAISTAVVVFLTTLAGYSVFRCRYRGRELFLSSLLMIYIFPRILLILSLFPVFSDLGLTNTMASLVISYVAVTAPLNVFIIRSFFVTVPTELEDSAFVDGATRLQTLYRIFIPLTAPGIGAVAINSFLMSYSEYLFASLLIISDAKKTIPVGMSQFLQQYSINWGALSAGSVLIIVPPIIGFAFVGRYFVKGLTAGAIK